MPQSSDPSPETLRLALATQDFIDRHIPEGTAAAAAQGAASTSGPGAAASAAAAPEQQAQQGQQAEQRGYLAQHPLFEQIPALAADIREPDYCVLGEGELQVGQGYLKIGGK